MTIDLAREIVKTSLRKYNGNKYSATIDTFNFNRNDFRGDICFYTSKRDSLFSIYLIFSSDIVGAHHTKNTKSNTLLASGYFL